MLGAGREDALTASHHDSPTKSNDSIPKLTCAALATGMKCLPQNKLGQAKGNVLHDWHAEVLAIRAFNRFLLDECADLARKGFKETDTGVWVRWRRRQKDNEQSVSSHNKDVQQPPFELHDDVSIHMYCSEAPCGDASMELTMAEQEDSTPWPTDAQSPAINGDLLGRGHFDQLGIVRRKPARPDAPLTLSKSCSDKLAMTQCTSLLSALTSQLVWPGNVYLDTVVLPVSQCVRTAVERAFGPLGRMEATTDPDAATRKRWGEGGYAFKPFNVTTTAREFDYSKRSSPAADPVPSNLSALSTPHSQENLINGVLQGRKQFDPRGASCASRREMWKAVADVTAAADPDRSDATRTSTYDEMKMSTMMGARERVKSDVRELSLKGWVRNVGDGEWRLEDD